MEIKKIVVNMGRTVNLGNFESARFDLSVEAETDALDDIKELEHVVSKNLEGMITRKLDSLLKKVKEMSDGGEDFI